VLVARRAERTERIAAELVEHFGVEVAAVRLDLATPDFLESLLAVCIGKEIGLLVSNAGSGLKGPHAEASPEKLARMLDLNCRVPMQLARAFAPRMIERGHGGMIFTGSIEAAQGFPYSAAYAATKAFVQSLGESLWVELGVHGIDVLVVNPGPTDTEALPLQGLDPASMTGVMAPGAVAAQALARLGRGPVTTPGRRNRLLMRALALLPRRAALNLAGRGILDAIEDGRRAGRSAGRRGPG
jgi:short-subunit dehydrogenase